MNRISISDLQKARARITALEAALETLCNGLAWNIENHPEIMNEADNEALAEARAVLKEQVTG